MSDIDPGTDHEPETSDLDEVAEAEGTSPELPKCPSLLWTVFWLIVFSPVAIYLAFRSASYRRAVKAAGGEPEARSLVIIVVTAICSLAWLLTAYLFAKYVVISFVEGANIG